MTDIEKLNKIEEDIKKFKKKAEGTQTFKDELQGKLNGLFEVLLNKYSCSSLRIVNRRLNELKEEIEIKSNDCTKRQHKLLVKMEEFDEGVA